MYALKYIFINFTLNSICWYHERFQYHIQALVKIIFVESRNGNILTEDSEIVKNGQHSAKNSITIQ